uniref:Uncharacterized protein n=1 Tax=Anopheles dirus TaxID=7168 RepID=A0A182NJB6_9DIPT
MLSVVITVVCFVCYCCHRNIKKRSNSVYRQQWLETEANMEIYSVEQCYDPPPSGTGGFFMDGSSSTGGGDYQSLPMVTSAINHANHLPQYPYHHQHYPQQQQHHYQYTLYPNGPPPSYDTVVAQDELLANAVSRRKRTLLHGEVSDASAGPSSHGCPEPEAHECDKQHHPGCTGATPLLPKTRASPRRCGLRTMSRTRNDHATSNERRYSDDPGSDEPLCAEERAWDDEMTHRDVALDDGAVGGEASCNCPATISIGRTGGQAAPPIYCRNCGYFVEGSGDISSTTTTAAPSSHSGRTMSANRRPVDSVELTRNDQPLLVDYETGDDVNRNNLIDDSSPTNTTTTTPVTSTLVDIDRLQTMRTTVAASCAESDRLDSANNNTPANETENSSAGARTAAGSTRLVEGEARQQHATVTPNFSMTNSANNNIITDASARVDVEQQQLHRLISSMDHPWESGGITGNTATGDNIIHQCPNTSSPMSNQCCNQSDSYLQPDDAPAPPPTLDDQTNGNSRSDSQRQPPEPPGGIRSRLGENGLVRLDMSQIIDNTGLPTYEAALKLESSGYV